MSNAQAILVDLDRCVECHACEIACKQENNLREGEQWIKVVSLGPEEVGGKLCSDYYTVIDRACHLCRHRLYQGLEPFCVTVCPTRALMFCTVSEVLRALRSKKRYQICTIATLED